MIMTASIAQLVEHGTENPCVAGSIPARGTFLPIMLFLYLKNADIAMLMIYD